MYGAQATWSAYTLSSFTPAERAAANEAARGLLPETLQELHEAGLFRFLQPARVGGAELDYVSLVDIGSELARGDSSVAWVVTNLASHHWMLAMWPEEAQDLLWGADPDVLIASSFVLPAGKAERAAGGYRLSGRWPFSSGVDCSSWNMLAGMVRADDGGAPEHRIFLVSEADYRVLDTWHASGLAGTASHDVVVEEAFVPEPMSVAVAELKGGPTPGAAVNPSPLYQIPVFALFPHILTGPALGNAKAVLEGFTAAMLGGLGNMAAVVVGGLTLGLIESIGAGYVPSGLREAIPMSVLILILLLRPTGIMGTEAVHRA